MKEIVLTTLLFSAVNVPSDLKAQDTPTSQGTPEQISESKNPHAKIEDFSVDKADLDLPLARNAVSYFSGKAVIAHNGDGTPRPTLLWDSGLSEVEFIVSKGIYIKCHLEASISEVKYGELVINFRYTYSVRKDTGIGENSYDFSKTWFEKQGVKKIQLTAEENAFLVINNKVKVNYSK